MQNISSISFVRIILNDDNILLPDNLEGDKDTIFRKLNGHHRHLFYSFIERMYNGDHRLLTLFFEAMEEMIAERRIFDFQDKYIGSIQSDIEEIKQSIIRLDK